MTRPSNICNWFRFNSLCALLVLFLLPSTANAQRRGWGEEKKSYWQTVREDSVPWLTAVNIRLDIVGPGMRLLGDYGQFEAQASLSIKDRFYPTLEIGYGSSDYLEGTTLNSYKASGMYARVGVDFNMLKDKHDIYKVFVGARYGFTSFDFDVHNSVETDPVWGGLAGYNADGVGCNYGWLELLFGVDAKIAGPVHLGWSARYKKKMSSSYDAFGKAWYVPGYGIDDSTGFGATFHVGIDIDLKKKQKAQPKISVAK